MSKNFYISTAISYTNGPPHIGHTYEAIAADVIARFHRLKGEDVFFLTGTDEHGLKVKQKAREENITPQELSNELSLKFIELTKTFNCSNDDFIRTTEERHKRSVKEIWSLIEKNGDIYLGQYSGWYSIRDEAYYGEEELKKDKEGNFLSPYGSHVEWVEEESYFFRLSKYQDRLLKLYDEDPDFISPTGRMNEVKSFVSSGLKDISISRKKLNWGIPVEKDPEHSIYVWLDALTNYISVLDWQNEGKLYKDFWPADLHLIGKDIVRFHGVYWPAFLMSANLALPKRIFCHGFILNKGEKVSKSLGNTSDPFQLVKYYGVDQLRYFLMRETPFGSDGNYSHELITNRVNADLANDLGNLAQRVLTMVWRNCDSKIPKVAQLKDKDKLLLESIPNLYEKLGDLMKNYQISIYISSIFEVISLTNKYISNEKPWDLSKNNQPRMNTVLWVACEMLRNITILLQPILVSGSADLLNALGISEEKRSFKNLGDGDLLKYGTKIPEPKIIFPKLEL
ncbi:MAG: methionine--tRNA ligase [Pseudomonadota bacterium]|nr:methionine--tRNA ligase [Pseudomonadota bacterium]